MNTETNDQGLKCLVNDLNGSGEQKHYRKYYGIIYKSLFMEKICKRIDNLAKTGVLIHLSGESGTGKEVVARAIHSASGRNPFIPVNCPGIPPTLMDSELFGSKKGSFTGATADRKGLFAAAENGTIFLDEISEISLDLQAKLLRVIQEKTIRPLGSSEESELNIRIITASNQNLDELISEKKLRADLFYRISPFVISIPSLRHRPEDVPALVYYFAEELRKQYNRDFSTSPEMISSSILDFSWENQKIWPGNVRQLRGFVERMLLEPNFVPEAPILAETELITLDSYMMNAERKYMLRVYHSVNCNATAACKILNISTSSFYRKMKVFGVKI